MVILTNILQGRDSSYSPNAPASNQPTAEVPVTSFSEQLASAAETYAPVERQDLGARQIPVALKEPVATATPAPLPPAPNPAALVSPPVLAGPERRLANGKPVLNEYDAYWATQPAEVQQLKDLPEPERMTKAHELADQGFIIDVPIMVWNWDPLTTMIVRRNQGFTWVPSAKQNPVQVAPGLTFPGLPSYDPKNPPPGSIKVSTDFAKGLEHTCPWLRDENTDS